MRKQTSCSDSPPTCCSGCAIHPLSKTPSESGLRCRRFNPCTLSIGPPLGTLSRWFPTDVTPIISDHTPLFPLATTIPTPTLNCASRLPGQLADIAPRFLRAKIQKPACYKILKRFWLAYWPSFSACLRLPSKHLKLFEELRRVPLAKLLPARKIDSVDK
eukprot:Gregarina_sp_Pseudo_9__1313@NODE_1879_length_1278_cov_25_577885_g524_i1_p2_GENE_NODE_1879_length_1278_cov_25_577885_g524_i1NODE_1879_length_1278_cov_25_577885_g524_i1_p2_ORF_typecomplete_len160_score12_21_NODE_1879_length_1278_cov_25_577885_g524_i1226705